MEWVGIVRDTMRMFVAEAESQGWSAMDDCASHASSDSEVVTRDVENSVADSSASSNTQPF